VLDTAVLIVFKLDTSMLLLLLILIAASGADLLSDRYNCTEIWTLRTESVAETDLAYSPQCSNANTTHIVQDTGNYGPYAAAYSYDSLVPGLQFIIGYSPVTLYTKYDQTTTVWIDNNTLSVYYTLNITTSNSSSVQYNQQGFRFHDYYVFPNGSAEVLLDYGIQDPAAIELFALSSSAVTPAELCFLIFAACNGSDLFGIPPLPYLNTTEYTSMADCIAFNTALPFDVNNSICPYPTRSNTTGCRATHAFAAFIDPSLHCPHTRKDSALCANDCLPACSNCDPNASCIATYPTLFAPVYQCSCNNGYIGNGSHCSPHYCSYGTCGATWDSYTCSEGNLCMCTETFQHDPNSTTDYCTCASPSTIYEDATKMPVCVPNGRCIDSATWQCHNQVYSQVQCTTYGNNTFTLFEHCLCNYGFLGGWEFPCVCPAGNRIVWSVVFAGDICLPPNQCTDAWHCSWPQTCYVASGQRIGTCM